MTDFHNSSHKKMKTAFPRKDASTIFDLPSRQLAADKRYNKFPLKQKIDLN